MTHFFNRGIIRKREKLEIGKGNKRDNRVRIEDLSIKFGSYKGQPEICTSESIRKIEFRMFCGKTDCKQTLWRKVILG